jgi:hypothetical protein
MGRLELDLPLSERRSYTLTMPLLAWHHHPTGSVNPFAVGDNQLGLEVSGHGEGPGLRYALAVVNADGLGSSSPFSSPVAWGHLTWTGRPPGRAVTRVRVGLFGDVGWIPIHARGFTPPGGGAVPVPGTAYDHRPFGQAGGELSVTIGPTARPLALTGAWLWGTEEGGLVAGGTRAATWHGGFVQADYTPWLPFTVAVRYDGVYPLVQADPGLSPDADQKEAFTLVLRYAIWLSAWGSVVAHAEVSTLETRHAGADPKDAVRATTLLAGLDLAL